MIKKRLIGLLLTVLFSASANAIELEEYFPAPWNDLVGITLYFGSDWDMARAEISFSSFGTKYIAFYIVPRDGLQECISEQDQVFYVNTQPIKGYFWCSKFADTDNRYYRFVAETDAGNDFIINTFKNSKEPVHIKHPVLTDIYISAEGFTAEWNKIGDKAL